MLGVLRVEGYEENTQKTLDRFTEYMIREINAGKFNEHLEKLIITNIHEVICIYLLPLDRMEDSETVYIKCEDGQAIITDNLDNSAIIKIIFNDYFNGCIRAVFKGYVDTIVYACDTLGDEYTGENKEIFDIFVTCMVDRINRGVYNALINGD